VQDQLYREGGNNHNWVNLKIRPQLSSGDHQGYGQFLQIAIAGGIREGARKWANEMIGLMGHERKVKV